MKILLTHRYYAPDTPAYANMLRTIAEGLATGTDHDVQVFASMPSYRGKRQAAKRETLNGVEVRRQSVFPEKSGIPGLRLLNVLIYCVSLSVHICVQRPDVVTASTFPPVIAGWVASLAAKLVGAKFIYHMQDVHPEVSFYAGERLGRGVVFKVLRWLDNQTLNRSATIVVLSEDMADTVRARGNANLPLEVLNNFLLGRFEHDNAAPEALVKPVGKRRVIFAGNLGRFQNTELLVGGVMAALEARADTELLLLGDGDALSELKARWQDHPQVVFCPFLPFEQAAGLIEDADIGLVSLTPNIYKVSYPSKMLTYAGSHLPMLALVEPQSHLARSIEDKDLGAVPHEQSPQGIADALVRLLDGPDLGPSVAAWDAAENGIEGRLAAWAKMIGSAPK